jgi:hypothetical protein
VTPRGSRLLTFDLSSLEAQSLRAEKIDTPVETGVIKRPAFAVGVPVGSFNPEESLRSKRLADLKMHRNALAELTQELGDCSLSPDERATRFREVNSIRAEADWIESVLKSSFVPQHGELQLISPEHLLVNRLFNVRSKQTPRERMLSFDITKGENVVCTYEGPELRQSEGHVFMTLMNLTRDFKVGTEVSFEPGEMCRAMSGYYDGKSRQRLRDAIKRLMHAVITFPEFSVHLVQRFNHPSSGTWSVVLDNDIVRLFQKSSYIWLDAPTRRALPEGLATWLYGYVRSQSRLIPTSVASLREMCGSEAKSDETFQRRLYTALNALALQEIVDTGWSIRAGNVYWRKPRKALALR